MKHGSLFSGIGGFDLAAEWMGWENVFHCEWMPFPRQVLKYHFPNSISYEDITKTDFTIHRGSIDILTGGFPCQPYSHAGKRKGTEDSRHLWPEMLRAIREIQPKWILGENVFGIVNWSGGLVFEQVQSEMEAEGYEVQPFVIPACAKDAPHRRDRTWFVAYSRHNSKRKAGSCTNDEGSQLATLHTKGQRRYRQAIFNSGLCDLQGNATDTNSNRLERSKINGSIESKWKKQNKQFTGCFQSNFQNFPTQSPICGGNDGISERLDSITFSKWRNESIKAYGNAVVPQIVFEIFKAIQKYEDLH